MESQPRTYTDREINHFLSDIRERLEKQDAMLIKILDQATKTNGRVNKLEFWRNAIGWGFCVIMTIVLFTLNYIK